MLAEIAKGCDEIDIDDRQPGDVIHLHPTHFALLVGSDRMVHTNQGVGRVVVEGVGRVWLRLLRSAWRIRGVED